MDAKTDKLKLSSQIIDSLSIPSILFSLMASQFGMFAVIQKNWMVSQPIMETGIGTQYIQPDMSDVSAYQNHLFSLQWNFSLVEIAFLLFFIIIGLSSTLFPKTIGRFLRWDDYSYHIILIIVGLLIGIVSFVYFLILP